MAAGLAAVAVQGAAAAGALCTLVLVWALARQAGTTRVLLTGVAVASVCGALVTLVLTSADESRVRSMVFWLAGDLSWDTHPALGLGVAAGALAGAVLLARPLNVLAAGDLRARSVGLDVAVWRALVYGIAAVLTAIAVVSAGTIGFVGLITPHFARLLFAPTITASLRPRPRCWAARCWRWPTWSHAPSRRPASSRSAPSWR